MAEFKLGRIRFIWKDVWTPNTTYIKDDIVRNGGKTYLCVTGHTSAPDFYTDLDNIPTRWNQVADGSEWKGDWATGTFYKLNDLVKDGGRLYICNESHTSSGAIAALNKTGNLIAGNDTITGLDTTGININMIVTTAPGYSGSATIDTNTTVLSIDGPTQVTLNQALGGTGTVNLTDLVFTTPTAGQPTDGQYALNDDITKWDLYLTAFDWKGDWTTYHRYRINDVVRYGGQSYVCNEEHVSAVDLADGLEVDQGKWDIYSESFEWNGDWVPNFRYKVNDVVLYGGTSYVCNEGHTSALTYTLGLEADQGKWDYLHKGVEYKGTWDRGATVTASIAGTTMTVTAVTFGALSPGQLITGSSVVGGTYIVSQATGTTGSTGTYVVSQTNTTNSTTVTAHRRYKINDVVKWGADLWINTDDYSTDPANTFEYDEDQGRWIQFVEGLEFENSWSSSTIYQPGDVVTYGGYAYVATTNHSNKLPTSYPTDWDLFTTGFKFQNDYDINTQYRVGDVVRLSGYTYVAILDNLKVTISAINTDPSLVISSNTYYNVITLSAPTVNLVANLPITFTGTTFGGIIDVDPISGLPKIYYVKQVIDSTHFTVSLVPNGAAVTLTTANGAMDLTTNPEPPCDGFWSRLNSGVKWIDAPVTYSAVAGTNLSGTGTSATFDVTRSGTYYTAVIHSGAAGTGYAVGNQIKILGTSLGGATPTNDITLTVATITGGGGTGPIATVTNTGTAVTWTTGTAYKQGDTVKWGVSTFICVLRHVAETALRPDNDLTGTYWNMLAAGAEAAVLTTQGDTLYFGGAGPTRLPIGKSGQVLKVLGDTPGWEYFGVIDQVYYVAPSGTDTPAPVYGITMDKPWKTVRYATEQIERGPQNPDARFLLENNRQFIQKEISGWIQSHYAVDIGSTIASTDGVRPNQFVLSSGTTVNLSVGMPIRFNGTLGGVVGGSDTFVSNVATNTQVMDNVIGGASPSFTMPIPTGGTGNASDAGYLDARRLVLANKTFIQTEIAAYMDATYNSIWVGLGTTGQAKCTRDIGYIVDALVFDLTYGGNLATQIAARSYYSNGTFVEPLSEKTAALAVQTYLKSFIDNIVQGTTGWGQVGAGVQDTSGTAGSAGAATFAQARVQEMYDTINTGTEPSTIGPDTSWVASDLSTAISTVAAAKTTIRANAISWIQSTYPTLTFNSTTCSRDVGYIIDALSYDAIFGSNLLSIVAARSYLRALTSTQLVVNNQLLATKGTIWFTGAQVKKTAAGTTYYVKTIVDNTHFTVSSTSGGVVFALTTSSGSMTGRLSYDTDKCERDMGYIVDALAYDLSHGGNSRSRNVCVQYINNAPLVYSLGQKTQTVAAINYGLTVITNVITNTDPVSSYQVTVSQYKNTSYVSETNALARLTSLVGQITSCITTGTTGSIPTEQLINYTINVKTGVYYETLPIIVPANVAVVGDELRSTNIRPSTSLVSTLDTPYTLAGYNRLAAVISDVVAGISITKTPSNTQSQYVDSVVGTGVEGAVAAALVRAARYTIDSGLNLKNDVVLSEPTGYNTSFLAGYKDGRDLIVANKAFIKAEVIQYITNNYASLTYDQTKCARDVGFIIDALRYDMTYGGNVQSLVVGNSYYAGTGGALQIGSAEVTATAAAYNYMKTIIQLIAVNSPVSALQTNVTQVSGTAGSAGSATFAGARIDDIVTTLTTGTAPSTTLPSTAWVASNLTTAQATLDAAKATIQANTITFINTNFPSLTYNSTKCSRDVGYVIDALGYDFMFDSNFQTYVNALSYARVDAALAVTTQKDATLAAWNYVKNQAIANVGKDDTAIARINTNMQLLIDIIYGGTYSGNNTPSVNQDDYNAARVLELNKEFLAEEVTAYITATYPSYTYNTTLCKRDVREIINGIKYDLIYKGNYKSRQAALYYVNAVTGSVSSDMFYVRNGVGIRNMTLQGLYGYLGPVNSYGTRRPTAGAYVSLDPGWGPADSRAWVTNKSCYVQNVTTFGTGCVGCKIDGTLHNGGNRSIVSNDFTQVLSDGIGVWCTGSQALTELVSVFSYYGHMGYLAENGGKIRATNGNSSYGTYGCVSEGVDATETPITAIVNNRGTEALITNVVTSGSVIYNLEYSNAGNYYDTATFTINGAGANAAAVADEFRDGGVFEVRITDPGNTGSTGGAGYITASNVAQGGNSTQITLAATDGALSSAYVGMRIQIVSGTGVGQYGYIGTYNNGSKIATVLKESTGTSGWDHVVPGTAIASALDLTTSYIIEPRLSFTAPTYTNTAGTQVSGTWYDVAYSYINATYSGVAATGGSGTLATFNVTKTGNTYSVTLNSGGTNYVIGDTLTIAGTSLGGVSTANDITITVTNVTSVSKAVTQFESSGFGAGGRFVAVSASGSQYSKDAITWTAGGALPTGSYRAVAGGQVSGATVYVATATGGTQSAKTTDNGATWTAGGALPASTNWEAVTYGNGVFIAVAGGASTTSNYAAYSTNGGTTWTSAALPATAGWMDVTYGAGKFVAIARGGNNVAYSTSNGQVWIASPTGLPSSTNWTSLDWGNGRFVAICGTGANSTTTAYSFDGITWYAGGALPSSLQWARVRYGQGVFVATTGTGSTTNVIATSEDGVTWTSRTVSASRAWAGALAFGNSDWQGVWAILGPTTDSEYINTGAKAMARAKVTDNKIVEIRITNPGSNYASAPSMTIGDPNRTTVLNWTVRIGNGVLANPSFSNRGSLYSTATATVDGNGYADIFQYGSYVNVMRLTGEPVSGSNVVFAGNPTIYKLVNVRSFVGTGPYTANFQVSPPMSVYKSPAHMTDTTMRIKYSQVRLTGHDLLSIGTGNFANTNYPGLPLIAADPNKELVEGGGGRVFYTSTDQDGNFRVGTLFSIEQATGVATLNADAFNLAGLNELTLGSVALGGQGATISEFSTDPFFTANSDAIVPTQRAIKAYINSQIGGGGSQLNVNTLTAGVIYIANNTISTTSGVQINVPSKMNFTGGIDGSPLAMNLFLQG